MERTSAFTDISGPVHFIDYGGSGEPIVMIHGLGGSHLNWDRLAPGLADDCHPYSLDLRGFGLTPLNSQEASLAAQVELVASFIREVASGRALVFGNSMGGTIAMLLARRHPDLVAGLALFAPGLPPQSSKAFNLDNLRYLGFPLLPVLGEAALRRYRDSAPPEERMDYLWEAMTADPSRIDAGTRQASIEMRRLRDGMEWAPAAYCQALRSISALMARRWKFRDMVHRIIAPTLLIHGMLDDTVPIDAADWLARERPDWTYVPIPDAGHVPQIELPDRCREIIRDWTKTTSAAPA